MFYNDIVEFNFSLTKATIPINPVNAIPTKPVKAYESEFTTEDLEF